MLNSCKNSAKILKIVSVEATMVAKEGEEKNAFFDTLIFIRGRYMKKYLCLPINFVLFLKRQGKKYCLSRGCILKGYAH